MITLMLLSRQVRLDQRKRVQGITTSALSELLLAVQRCPALVTQHESPNKEAQCRRWSEAGTTKSRGLPAEWLQAAKYRQKTEENEWGWFLDKTPHSVRFWHEPHLVIQPLPMTLELSGGSNQHHKSSPPNHFLRGTNRSCECVHSAAYRDVIGRSCMPERGSPEAKRGEVFWQIQQFPIVQ